MKMGEYIRRLRNGANVHGRRWSQEELGLLLDPPVNKAAVNKWETGRVENIKRTHIEQLAQIFGIKPHELMCFESTHDEFEIAQEVKVIEQIQKQFGKEAVLLLQFFNELNDIGKEKAIDDLADLMESMIGCGLRSLSSSTTMIS